MEKFNIHYVCLAGNTGDIYFVMPSKKLSVKNKKSPYICRFNKY